MKYTDIKEYVDARSNNLTKFECTLECDPDEVCSYWVTKTKETYTFSSEEEADACINDARNDAGFAGCDKKFKAGKVNKKGEETRPDAWIVVLKLAH